MFFIVIVNVVKEVVDFFGIEIGIIVDEVVYGCDMGEVFKVMVVCFDM